MTEAPWEEIPQWERELLMGEAIQRRGPQLVDEACQVLHNAYEEAALVYKWETQARSRKPWSEVPEANKATMRAAMLALFDWLEKQSD